MSTTITVDGMSCAGCADSVGAELMPIPGVVGVDVDITHGTVTIDCDNPVDPATLRAAVEEAGYSVTGRPV